MNHEQIGVYSQDERRAFERLCMLAVDYVVQRRTKEATVKIPWGLGGFEEDPDGGEPYSIDTVMRAHPCQPCKRTIPAGLPSQVAGTQWDRCPACVHAQQLVRALQDEMRLDLKPMTAAQVHDKVTDLAKTLRPWKGRKR